MRHDDTIYRGRKTPNTAGPAMVTVQPPGDSWAPLAPRNDLRDHSPDGFQWGYSGSGPAQLALALLADCTNDEFAQEVYQDFKRDVIARLGDEWHMTAGSIRAMVKWTGE